MPILLAPTRSPPPDASVFKITQDLVGADEDALTGRSAEYTGKALDVVKRATGTISACSVAVGSVLKGFSGRSSGEIRGELRSLEP